MCALVDAQPIPGFSGFLVSKEGRVYTLNNARGLRRTPLELRAKPDKGGYPRVKLRGTHKSVHRLVALTYLGPCPEGLEVRHLDGRQDNPSLDNLTYGTTKENAADRLRHGTQPFGERHPFARFTDAQVREAVELYLTTPLTQAEVALRFGTSQQVVSGWVACHRLGLHQRSRAGRMKSHGTVASYSGRVAADKESK